MDREDFSRNPIITDKRVEEDVKLLKEWYHKQPHLPKNVEDVLFYHYAKNAKSLEKAKMRLDAYFTLKGLLPDYQQNWDPLNPIYKDALKALKVFFLPGYAHDGSLVLMVLLDNLKHFNFKNKEIRLAILTEIRCRMYPEDCGYLLVHDFTGYQSSILTQIELPMQKASLLWLTKALAVRPKQFLLINAMPSAELIINTFIKPFVKNKITQRISIHRDAECLKELIPLQNLPSEYGGKGPSVDELNDYWNKIVESKSDWLRTLSTTMTSDETRRPKEAYSTHELHFGLPGTFKNLVVD